MRLLWISYELPPIGGGGGRAAWQIARRLAQRGHEVTILTSLHADLAPSEEIEGVRVRRIRVRRARADACRPSELLSFMLRSPGAASRLAAECRPEVVCAFFGIPGGPAAWWLERRRGIPYVLSLRGSDVPRPELARYQRLHRFTGPVLRRIYRKAAAIVAVSDALRSAALDLEPRVHIEVIGNGVDTEFFRPSRTKRFRKDKPKVLFVGRLQKFKGVQYALRALPLVEDELGAPLRLIVAGDGPYRSALESLAKEIRSGGCRSKVRFKGWVGQEEVRALYESASLLVLPSLVEGHPNVLLEAMAMGLPCVASDAPGTREVLADGRPDFLTPPGDVEVLGHAMARALKDKNTWRSLSDAARARAEQFSWDAVAEQYEAVLARAAEMKATA